MELVFELTEHQTKSSRQKNKITFMEAGGVIGRDPASDWVLEDKSRRISGRHAEVFFDDGQFYITDRSTNGTFDVKTQSRLQKDEDYPIEHGDAFRIGSYVFKARVSQDADLFIPHNELDADVSAIIPDDEFLENDPFAILAEQDVERLPTEVLPEFEFDDDLSDLDQPFIAPEFETKPVVIPEEDDLLDELAIETPVMTKPLRQPKARKETASTPEVKSPEQSETDLTPLSQALGFDLNQLSAEEQAKALHNLGRLTRQTIIGLQQLLRTRADFKNKLRLVNTMVQETNNNPLKLVGNYEQTIRSLLVDQAGYLGPQAIKYALKDLQAHQVASFAASSGIQDSTFDVFSPANLVYRFEREGKPGAFTSKEAFYWQQYQRYFQKLSGDVEWRQSQFMHDYTRIYEEQAQYIHTAWTEFEDK